MPQRRGTATDQLANLIQVIQLGRKTGTLTVERGEGTNLEEGVICFVHGQITEAYTGQKTSQLALNWLNSWGACRFTFVPTRSDQQTGPLPALARDSIASKRYDTNPRLTGAIPALPASGGGTQTQPLGNASSAPRRILPAEEALRLLGLAGLSRTHRHLFLLIDGQRSTGELVRLMGRKQDEVQKLLRDLEYIKVIQQ